MTDFIERPEDGSLRIAITVPSHGEWKAGFGHSLANMLIHTMSLPFEGQEHGKTIDFRVISVTSSILPDGRHRCVAEALKWGATHQLWLDADMLFPVDTLARLLANRQNPVVGCNYVRRTMPTIPTAHDGKQMVYTTDEATGLQEVDHCGFGAMLVDTRVYDALELPLFMFEPYKSPETGRHVGFLGEDVYFLRNCRKAGITVYVDHDASRHIGHIGEMIYTHKHAEISRAEKAKMQARQEAAE